MKEETSKRFELYKMGLRVFWRNVRPYKLMFFSLVALSVVMGWIATYVKVLAGGVVDAFGKQDSSIIVRSIVIIALLYLIDAILKRYFLFYKVRAGYLMQLFYRTELYKKMLGVTSSFIKQKNIGWKTEDTCRE